MNKAIEKLKEEFKEANYMERVIINNCLLPEIHNNPEFAKKILNDKKSVKDAVSTIRNWVRNSDNHTPSHNIIFSAALHYYQEDDPKFVKEIFEEEKLKFGNIEKEFNTPIIKYITGTVIKSVIKEVESKSPKNKINKKNITKKVNDSANQLSIFEV